MRSRSVKAALLSILVSLTVVVATATPAFAHTGGNIHVHWRWTGTGYWNVDQYVIVKQKAKASYWALSWNYTNSSDSGYMGLQTNGNRFDGTTGDTAIFSLWNANAATDGQCGTFGGEGVGYSCRIAYPITKDTWYRYRVWRLGVDSGGQWWGAWILNNTTGVETFLGRIRVSASKTLMANAGNFSEYFGAQVACDQVPKSIVDFTQPAANSQGNGVYQFGSTFLEGLQGTCIRGGVVVVDYGWTRAARVTMGS